MTRTSGWVVGLGLVFAAAVSTASAQTFGIASNRNEVQHDLSGTPFNAGPVGCTLIDFEGIADGSPVGVIAGTPNVTFGVSWTAFIDFDAGGSGNFANEPSPDTGATFLGVNDPIDFDAGVQFIEVFYTAAAVSVPLTLTAWDGPGGTGSVVDTAVGATVGTSTDGAPCAGDPTGTFCLWDSLQLTSGSNNILSVTLSGAVSNQFGFDNMTFCTAVPATGACCAALGCTVTTAANCASLSGTYRGDGTDCDPDPCSGPQLPAASPWSLAGLLAMLLAALSLVPVLRRRALLRRS